MNSNITLEVKNTFSQKVDSTNQTNAVHSIELEEAIAVGRMKQIVDLTGLPMMAVDVKTGVIFAKSNSEMVTILPGELMQQLSNVVDCKSVQLETGLIYLVAPLPKIDDCETVAIGSIDAGKKNDHTQLMQQTAMTGLSKEQRELWIKQQQSLLPTLMQNMVKLALQNFNQGEQEVSLRSNIHQQQHQLDRTVAGMRFLHRLSEQLNIKRDPIVLVENCLQELFSLLPVQGQLILLDDDNGSYFCHCAGQLPFNESEIPQFLDHCDGHDWHSPIVNHHVEGSLLGSQFPELKNFLMTPIPVDSGEQGWLICCNLTEDRNYTATEISLVHSVASVLGTHLHNTDLCEQNDHLVLSFVRSMVSTLDAKDPYTRGHSERVALIARSLGEAMGLPEADLHNIYVAGLLHDIGKIGVSDIILQKPGALTDEEFDEIKTHPTLGYEILKDMKNLKMVLPGVRSHHENIDGTGYPDQLVGDKIPMMARILAVADAYDAMGSDRPYRKGMPLKKVEDIFRLGAGKQWDENIINLYFSIREEIEELCSNYSLSQGTLIDVIT